ncbi:MAG TPA: DNA polymerase III subunit alpha, partial [Acidimicrobiales bacterium]|nr:DNA polymerase III subunit alpha [Acidimicrobiales bacterium]
RHRDELIRYAAERYGRDHVAQIITFSQIKARAAVRDAARVLGHPYGLGDRVAKAMPQLIMGRDTPLAACLVETDEHSEGFKMAADLRQMYETDNDVREVVDVARGLEGLRRQDSIHAAAVVITKEPLTEYLPIQRKPESGQDPADAPVVTQFEMHAVEDLGLLKMDFLGLRNLDVITDTLALVEATRGEVIDIDNVQLDDAATFDLLARGDTIGVFQLESGPMRSLMRSLAPTGFQDVAALVALYRPGPMSTNMHNDYADRKNGRQPVSYFHPDAEELLADTYGLMIYQESVMRVAQKFAGYSMADADNLRKACGKKDRDLMQKERKGFVSGCEATGYGGALGDDLFDDIEQFADYAFNKSHSYGYGYIAYQIAFLKANYPVEYMAALLTSVKSNLDKAAVYLNECRIMGIDVGVPDINTARSDFHALPGDQVGANGSGSGHRIAFGLSAVRNVGEGLVDLLLAERDSGGPFADFYDFVERCDSTVLNKRTVESLIKAGAFDTFGHPRQGLLLAHEQVIEHTLARRREHDMGVMSLFGEGDSEPLFDERTVISDVEFDKTVRLAFEKEMLGLYVSDHPLSGYEVALRRRCDMAIADLADVDDGMQHTIGGVLTNLQKKWTRKGDLMAVFDLEDLGGSVEVTVFPKTMAEHGHKLEEDAIVLVRGRLDDRRGAVPKILCHEVEVVEMGDLPSSRPVRLRLPIDRVSRSTVDELKELLSAHPGDAEVYLHLGDRQVLRLPADYCVNPSGGLVGELRVLLGAEAVVTG